MAQDNAPQPMATCVTARARIKCELWVQHFGKR